MPCQSHAGHLGVKRNFDWYSLMLHGFTLCPWTVVSCYVVVRPESEDRPPRLKQFVYSSVHQTNCGMHKNVTLVCSRKRHLVAVVGRHTGDVIWKQGFHADLFKACCWIISHTGLLPLLFFVVPCERFVAEVQILGTFNLSGVSSGFYSILHCSGVNSVSCICSRIFRACPTACQPLCLPVCSFVTVRQKAKQLFERPICYFTFCRHSP